MGRAIYLDQLMQTESLLVPASSPYCVTISRLHTLVHDAELVLGVVQERLACRRVDLELVTAPLLLVDAVDPLYACQQGVRLSKLQGQATHILGLDNNAAVFLHIGSVGQMLLTALDRDRTVLAVTGVDLQALLVAAKTHLDAGAWCPHPQHLQLWVLRVAVPRAIENESVVVPDAAGAT